MVGRLDWSSFQRAAVLTLALLLTTSCTQDSVGDPPSDAAVTATSPFALTTTTVAPVATTTLPSTTTSTVPPPEPCVFSDPQSPDGEWEAGGLVENIEARGVVRVGVLPDDFAPFFFCNQGVESGFEASIARLLVEDAFGDVEIQWVPLATGDRIAVVQEGGVDFAVRLTTVTPEREGQVAFNTPYLLDGPAVVVPAAAGIKDVAGLDGQRIALLEGTELTEELTETLESAGVSFEPIQAEALEDLTALVADGDADAYGTTWTRGMFETQESGSVVVPLSFTSAIAVYASHDEPALSAVLNASLVNLIDSGLWSSEFLLAFGVPSPWSLDEMALAR